MTLAAAADDAFAYLETKFGPEFATRNQSAALRFAGAWLMAASGDEVAQAVHALQDVLFVPDAAPVAASRQDDARVTAPGDPMLGGVIAAP